MKYIKQLLVVSYLIIGVIILILAIVYPLIIGMDDNFPVWSAWLIYPLSVVVIASQSFVLKNFKKNTIKDILTDYENFKLLTSEDFSCSDECIDDYLEKNNIKKI